LGEIHVRISIDLTSIRWCWLKAATSNLHLRSIYGCK